LQEQKVLVKEWLKITQQKETLKMFTFVNHAMQLTGVHPECQQNVENAKVSDLD